MPNRSFEQLGVLRHVIGDVAVRMAAAWQLGHQARAQTRRRWPNKTRAARRVRALGLPLAPRVRVAATARQAQVVELQSALDAVFSLTAAREQSWTLSARTAALATRVFVGLPLATWYVYALRCHGRPLEGSHGHYSPISEPGSPFGSPGTVYVVAGASERSLGDDVGTIAHESAHYDHPSAAVVRRVECIPVDDPRMSETARAALLEAWNTPEDELRAMHRGQYARGRSGVDPSAFSTRQTKFTLDLDRTVAANVTGYLRGTGEALTAAWDQSTPVGRSFARYASHGFLAGILAAAVGLSAAARKAVPDGDLHPEYDPSLAKELALSGYLRIVRAEERLHLDVAENADQLLGTPGLREIWPQIHDKIVVRLEDAAEQRRPSRIADWFRNSVLGDLPYFLTRRRIAKRRSRASVDVSQWANHVESTQDAHDVGYALGVSGLAPHRVLENLLLVKR